MECVIYSDRQASTLASSFCRFHSAKCSCLDAQTQKATFQAFLLLRMSFVNLKIGSSAGVQRLTSPSGGTARSILVTTLISGSGTVEQASKLRGNRLAKIGANRLIR